MAFFITGDTHGDFRRFLPENFYEQESLTRELLIHLLRISQHLYSRFRLT